MSERDDLIRACRALGAMVRSEYPAGYSLAQIVNGWGVGDHLVEPTVTAEDADAVARVEHLISED